MTQLSILVPTLVSRRGLRQELFTVLERQAKFAGDVEILWEEDDGRIPSGTKRNRLMGRSRGEYVCFVDDDDMVTPDYVQRIRLGTLKGDDVVSFQLERIGDDRPRAVHSFSIHHHQDKQWSDGVRQYQANHLCAWRRDLALAVPFPPNIGYDDDVFSYTPRAASGLVETEYHIPEVLYTYYYRSTATGNQSRLARERTFRWAAGGVDYFWDYRQDRTILAAVTGRANRPADGTVEVRQPDGQTRIEQLKDLRRFCTVLAK